MVEVFIDEDETKQSEAVAAAISAIDVRMQFRDGVQAALLSYTANITSLR